MEASPNEKISHKNIASNFFNISMTFRKTSTIWLPYNKFEEIKPEEKDNETLVWSDTQIDNIMTKKKKLAVIFVSNCETNSKRELFLAELHKYASIAVFGDCADRRISDEQMKAEIERHYFYLAFENAVCEDYVTEKFWRLKQLIVPVVLKRSVLKGVVDDEYFIAADDFDSAETLVHRLLHLSKNPNEYKKYVNCNP
uniref:Fucosyltransferase n=1 Tax=Panagrolaimus sp. ES5 TaxID=591445 RepID=A0AC34FRH2_9BILA